MANWTSVEIKWVTLNLHLSNIDLYNAYCEAFPKVERSYDRVRRKIKDLRTQLLSTNTTGDELIEEINTYSIKELKEKAKTWAASVVEATKNLSTYYSPVLSVNHSSLVLLLSDLHFGKESMGFNIDVAKERIAELPEKLLQQLGATADELDEIIIVLAGDIVEGEDIFDHQAHQISCPVIDQAKIATESIWKLIFDLHNIYLPNCSIRIETCPGNHGRVSYKANPKTNWDNVVYQQLHLVHTVWKEHAKNTEWFSLFPNMEPFRRFKVKDKWCVVTHHGVKHTGTPSMLYKLAGWNQTMPFDVLMHGHWHNWEVGTQFGKAVVKNGSLSGQDDLALTMGAYDPARQAYFIITPDQPLKNFSYLEW